MSLFLTAVLAGAAGGTVVVVCQPASRWAARFRRLIWRRHSRVAASLGAAQARGDPPDQAYLDRHAAHRAAQARTYADHLAHGDARLREHLRRFENSTGADEYRQGDQPW